MCTVKLLLYCLGLFAVRVVVFKTDSWDDLGHAEVFALTFHILFYSLFTVAFPK